MTRRSIRRLGVAGDRTTPVIAPHQGSSAHPRSLPPARHLNYRRHFRNPDGTPRGSLLSVWRFCQGVQERAQRELAGVPVAAPDRRVAGRPLGAARAVGDLSPASPFVPGVRKKGVAVAGESYSMRRVTSRATCEVLITLCHQALTRCGNRGMRLAGEAINGRLLFRSAVSAGCRTFVEDGPLPFRKMPWEGRGEGASRTCRTMESRVSGGRGLRPKAFRAREGGRREIFPNPFREKSSDETHADRLIPDP